MQQIIFIFFPKPLPEAIFGGSKRPSILELPIKIHIRLRACRRPSVFSPAKFVPPPNSRDALMSLLQGADPLDPKGPQGPHPNPPREPKGTRRAQGERKGAKGTQRGPRAPSAPLGGWAHGSLWGYSEAVPNGKPFRMERY